MRHCTPSHLVKSSLLSILAVTFFSAHAFAAPAGRVDFTSGKVSATGADGMTRTLSKGAEINNGDSIDTGDGRIHIRFSDGAYMSLQPKTIFKVENYAFEEKSDGKELGIFSLLKGGLRTITGLIGRVNKRNYEVRTPTATIGIRGTAYSANQSDDGLTVTVGRGLVAVSNEGGSLTIGSGQSAFVRSPQSSPTMTDEKALAPQTQTQEQQEEQAQGEQEQQQEQQQQAQQTLLQEQQGETTTVLAGEQLTTTGESAVVGGSTPVVVGPTVLTTGPGYSIAYGTGSTMITPAIYYHGGNNTGTFDAGGTLKSITDGSNTLDFNAGAAAFAPETGSDTLIGWGRWTGPLNGNLPGGGGTNYTTPEGLHYVVGIPVPTSNPIFSTGIMATYAMSGSTVPTTIQGTQSSASSISGLKTASVNFLNPANVTMTLNFTVTSAALSKSWSLDTLFGAIPLSFQGGQSLFVANQSGPGCGTGACFLEVHGLFTGAGAERLGIVYNISDPNVNGSTIGAAAFVK